MLIDDSMSNKMQILVTIAVFAAIIGMVGADSFTLYPNQTTPIYPSNSILFTNSTSLSYATSHLYTYGLTGGGLYQRNGNVITFSDPGQYTVTEVAAHIGGPCVICGMDSSNPITITVQEFPT